MAFDNDQLGPDQKQFEDDYLNISSKLEAIFKAFPDLCFVIESDGTIVEYRAGRSEDLYVPPENFLGHKMQDVLPADVGLEFKKIFQIVLDTKQMHSQEYSLTLKDGTKRFESRILPIHKNQLVIFVRDITEQRKAEDALREGEARFKRLLESVSDYVYTVKVENGKPVSTTHGPGCVSVTGYTSQEFLSSPMLWYQMVHPDDRQAVLYQAEAAIKTGNAEALEHRIIHKNNTILWVRNTPVVRKDDSGRVIAYEGVITNITEQKKAEEVLRASEEQMRLFVLHTPAAVAMFDTKMRYILASRRWSLDYHLGNQNIIGRSHYDVFPEIPQRWKDIHSRCLAGATEKCNEDPFDRADGSTDWVRWEIYPWYLNNKDIGGIIMFTELITERKKAQELAYRQSTAMNASMDGVAIHDSEERFVYLNDAHAKIYGYDSAQDLLGQSWQILYDESEVKRIKEEVMPVFKAKGHWKGEAVGKRKDGTLYPQEISLTAIQSGGLICVVRDITDRKKIEAELERYRKHLEDLVEERTRELRHSERLAATGRLAASIAHEINNPLQGITTHLEIIRDHFPKNFQKMKNYESVKSNIEKIREIVTKLLNTYRGGDESKTEVDLNDVIEKVVTLVEHQLTLKGIHLELKLMKGLPALAGWRQQLHQVFLNLILNAQDSIKPQAKGRILVTTTAKNDCVVVAIADNGEGIHKKDMDHLFDPFFTTKPNSGTGLGLFVSQGIIKEHNGSIKVKSEVGQGSVFTVTLPLKKVEGSHGE